MELKEKRRIIVSVTTDLVTDNRVHKTCTTLSEMGFDVLVVGRELPGSPALSIRNYSAIRLKLLFRKGPLFYACFNIRLFCFLLFRRFDLLLANDLDTLPANFFISKLRRKPLVYDSHEFFTGVPELVHRPGVRRFWEWIEQLIVPKLKYAYTVSGSIAGIYSEKYGVPFRVVRNVPVASTTNCPKSHPSYGEGKIVIYQGAVNAGRGLAQAIRAMKYLEGVRLLIAGDGDIRKDLERLTREEGLQDRVQFLGRLTIDDLNRLTPLANVGLSIEEDLGLNYRFALPNKLFDYIRAQVPVLVTDLPEMAAIVRRYGVGEVTASADPKELSVKLSEMLNDDARRKVWKENLGRAAKELTWENEERVLREIFCRFR